MARHPRFSPLVPVRLTHVTTSDGIDLSGVIVEPNGRKKAALIWLHGLTSSFDSGQELMRQLSATCVRRGIGYFKFNTRGHHLVDFGSHANKKTGLVGATYESFRSCRKDIDAIIRLAKRRGYKKIILAGHSTGASKVLYYTVKVRRPSVKALLLAGPASDIAGELKKHSARTLLKRVAQARRWVRRNPVRMVPTAWGPWSAARYVSLFTPNGAEDVFPYHRLGGRWTYLSRVRLPLMMVLGGKDAYIDRPTKKLMTLYKEKSKATRSFTGVVVPGASHGFGEHQRQLVRAIGRWLDKVV